MVGAQEEEEEEEEEEEGGLSQQEDHLCIKREAHRRTKVVTFHSKDQDQP